MESEFRDRQIEILRRTSGHPFRPHGPCVVRLHPWPQSRVVELKSGRVRIAFKNREVALIAKVMNRTHPRLQIEMPALQEDCNADYVPGDTDRPFLVAFSGPEGVVRIGMEIADRAAHPVAELTASANLNVRQSGDSVTWLPRWTEIRVLTAEFEQIARGGAAGNTCHRTAKLRTGSDATGDSH